MELQRSHDLVFEKNKIKELRQGFGEDIQICGLVNQDDFD
jgi:hypothetical protein